MRWPNAGNPLKSDVQMKVAGRANLCGCSSGIACVAQLSGDRQVETIWNKRVVLCPNPDVLCWFQGGGDIEFSHSPYACNLAHCQHYKPRHFAARCQLRRRRNHSDMTSNDREARGDGLDAPAEFEEVFHGCCAGHRDAQRRLYELYHAQVYRLAVRMIGREEAQDLVQQVFLQLYCKIEKFAGRSTFDTWLFRLATNEALQYLRKKKRWSFEPLSSELVSPVKPRVDINENTELLEVALTRLDPVLRAVFILKEFERLSYHDIATSVNVPEGTVGSRLNRARGELQRHLAELGWEG